MQRIDILLAVLICFVLLTPASAMGFAIPEKLVFDLSWGGIRAGTMTQEISAEGSKVRIVSVARSNAWLSHFFPVDDRVESVLAQAKRPRFGLPQHFRMKVREGKHQRDREILFHQKSRKAVYIDHLNNEKATIDIPGDTYDTTSCLYYVRTMPLEVGKPVFVNVLENKQVLNMEVRVLKKEKMKTVLGKVNTILLRQLAKAEGMLHEKGTIDIWVTDDERHIPVKIKTKIAVGSITATLAKMN